MSNAGGQSVFMTPIADVTATFPFGHFTVPTADGFWIVDANAANISKAMRLYDQKIANFSPALPLAYYRNSITKLIYDPRTDRFCGLTGGGGGNPNTWDIFNGSGSKLRGAYFSGKTINTEVFDVAVPCGGKFFGIIETDSANLGPQCYSDDGANLTNWLWQQSGGFTLGCILGENYLQLNYPGAGNQLVYWLCANDFYFGDFGFVPNPIPDFFGDFPLIKGPLQTDIKEAAYSSQPWNDGTAFRNYTFQQTGDGKIFIAAVGQSGTNLTPITGTNTSGTDYSAMSFPPPFDVALGGSRYTPIFPKTFTFNGSPYDMGSAGQSVVRTMAMTGGMLFAVVSVNGPGATVIFASGFDIPFAEIGLFQYDTLNWKRSLVYGKGAGDGP